MQFKKEENYITNNHKIKQKNLCSLKKKLDEIEINVL